MSYVTCVAKGNAVIAKRDIIAFCNKFKVNPKVAELVLKTGVSVMTMGSYQKQFNLTIPKLRFGEYNAAINIIAIKVGKEEDNNHIMLHELIHWTAKYKERWCFWSYEVEEVSKHTEEMVAEMGATLLGKRLGALNDAQYTTILTKASFRYPHADIDAARKFSSEAVVFLNNLEVLQEVA